MILTSLTCLIFQNFSWKICAARKYPMRNPRPSGTCTTFSLFWSNKITENLKLESVFRIRILIRLEYAFDSFLYPDPDPGDLKKEEKTQPKGK
jgi:hypothetical protein